MGVLAGDGVDAMTCIVAIETPDGVWMGGDRMSAGANQGTIQDNPKITRNGNALIGTCGSVRWKQLLRYALVVPEWTLGWDVDRWVALDLSKAVMETLTEWKVLYEANNVAHQHNGLFAIRGRCYELQSDYSFTRRNTGEYAVGSGEEYALGALHATRDWDDPEARVRAALEAAAEFNPYVAGPFDIEWQEAV